MKRTTDAPAPSYLSYLDRVAEVDANVWMRFAEQFAAESDRLAETAIDQIEYAAARDEAALRIARNLFALTFA